jgi:purine nucleosidase
MPRKVILDVDPGIDDALALCMALFDPRLEVVAVTAVGGNVPPQQATRNVQAIVEQLDPPRLPRLGAAARFIPIR